MVGDTGLPGVQIATAEIFGSHHLAGGGLHQRRAAQEDGALVANDHRLVAHRRHVSATGRAGSEHRCDLRHTGCAHGGLVVEDPAEVIAVREHLVLAGQERTAGVHQVDARQPVLRGDLLGTQVLLDRHRVVGAALDGGVVGHHHAFPPRHPADTGDDAGRRALVVVHAVGGQWRHFEKRAARVQQAVDPLPRKQLPAGDVALARPLGSAECGSVELGAQLADEFEVRVAVGGR